MPPNTTPMQANVNNDGRWNCVADPAEILSAVTDPQAEKVTAFAIRTTFLLSARYLVIVRTTPDGYVGWKYGNDFAFNLDRREIIYVGGLHDAA
jgi:hypothetical protein